jgi:hypothetical protein
MDIEEIWAKVRSNAYGYTQHAELERAADNLTFSEIEAALLGGAMLEHYPDTGRGESCLIVGFAGKLPIHIVCGWRGDQVVVITVYVPQPPHFVDPWTRGK